MFRSLNFKKVNRTYRNRYVRSYTSSQNIQGLPFKINEKMAYDILVENTNEWDTNKFREEIQKNGKMMEKHYIPYYVAEFKNIHTKYQAKYEKEDTLFIPVPLLGFFPFDDSDSGTTKDNMETCNYGKMNEEMHAYAGCKYPDYFTKKLINLSDFAKIETIKTAEIDVEQKKLSDIIAGFVKVLKILEEIRIQEYVKRRHSADSVKVWNMEINVDEAKISLHQYYIPVYVYKYKQFGMDIIKMINGYDGKIISHKHYSFPKIATGFTLLNSYIVTGLLMYFYDMSMIEAINDSVLIGLESGMILASLLRIMQTLNIRSVYSNMNHHKLENNGMENYDIKTLVKAYLRSP